MKLFEIKKINELDAVLREAAEKWRADYDIEIIAVASATATEVQIEYSILQEDHVAAVIEMPVNPVMCIRPSDLDFHISALRVLLLRYAPEDTDWEEAAAELAARVPRD